MSQINVVESWCLTKGTALLKSNRSVVRIGVMISLSGEIFFYTPMNAINLTRWKIAGRSSVAFFRWMPKHEGNGSGAGFAL